MPKPIPTVDDESDHLASIRHQLIILVRRKGARQLDWPRKWHPTQTRDPRERHSYFTHEGAWEFIADVLEARHPFEEVDQDDPPGIKAYQMVVDIGEAIPPVFIKVRLGAGKVLGRSFHNSTIGPP